MRWQGVLAFVALLDWGQAAAADDLSQVRAIRSLAAEAAEIIRLQAQHRVTETYAREMKQQAREQLQSEAEGAQRPPLGQMAQQAIVALGRDDSNTLMRIVQQLLKMEGPHGRAD